MLLFLFAAVTFFLHFTIYGRYLYAIGSNERAARYSGINVDFYKILAYVLCSLLTAVYSFLAVMNSPSVAPSSAGQGDELIAIAGAVLGGCSLAQQFQRKEQRAFREIAKGPGDCRQGRTGGAYLA